MGCCQGYASLFRTGNLIPTGSRCCTDPWQGTSWGSCWCPFACWWDTSSPCVSVGLWSPEFWLCLWKPGVMGLPDCR